MVTTDRILRRLMQTDRNFSLRALAGIVLSVVSSATIAAAQDQPAAASKLKSEVLSPVVGNPNYVVIPLEIVVDRPVAEVWKRIGKYCDFGEWMQQPCEIVSGKDGEYGAIRSAGPEPIVAKTQYSYTYAMPPRTDRAFEFYHGTLEARPLTGTTTKILYTLFYDDSVFVDDVAREKEKARRITRFTQGLKNMKILAEGGTLPPLNGPAPGKRPKDYDPYKH